MQIGHADALRAPPSGRKFSRAALFRAPKVRRARAAKRARLRLRARVCAAEKAQRRQKIESVRAERLPTRRRQIFSQRTLRGEKQPLPKSARGLYTRAPRISTCWPKLCVSPASERFVCRERARFVCAASQRVSCAASQRVSCAASQRVSCAAGGGDHLRETRDCFVERGAMGRTKVHVLAKARGATRAALARIDVEKFARHGDHFVQQRGAKKAHSIDSGGGNAATSPPTKGAVGHAIEAHAERTERAHQAIAFSGEAASGLRAFPRRRIRRRAAESPRAAAVASRRRRETSPPTPSPP